MILQGFRGEKNFDFVAKNRKMIKIRENYLEINYEIDYILLEKKVSNVTIRKSKQNKENQNERTGISE